MSDYYGFDTTALDRWLTRGDRDDDVSCTGECGEFYPSSYLDERGECGGCARETAAFEHARVALDRASECLSSAAPSLRAEGEQLERLTDAPSAARLASVLAWIGRRALALYDMEAATYCGAAARACRDVAGDEDGADLLTPGMYHRAGGAL